MTGPRRRTRDHAATLEHAATFARQRELAEQYPCDQPPLGCAARAGESCTAIGHPDIRLTRRPAHLGRLRRAGLGASSTVGSGARRETDRPPDAPIPAANRAIYEDHDDPDPYQENRR